MHYDTTVKQLKEQIDDLSEQIANMENRDDIPSFLKLDIVAYMEQHRENLCEDYFFSTGVWL